MHKICHFGSIRKQRNGCVFVDFYLDTSVVRSPFWVKRVDEQRWPSFSAFVKPRNFVGKGEIDWDPLFYESSNKSRAIEFFKVSLNNDLYTPLINSVCVRVFSIEFQYFAADQWLGNSEPAYVMYPAFSIRI